MAAGAVGCSALHRLHSRGAQPPRIPPSSPPTPPPPLLPTGRLIFEKEQANYDLFISQEDDAMVVPHHLSYFLRWTNAFRGTPFYPGRRGGSNGSSGGGISGGRLWGRWCPRVGAKRTRPPPHTQPRPLDPPISSGTGPPGPHTLPTQGAKPTTRGSSPGSKTLPPS